MTREEMWKEFEYQLIRETRISMTMSFDAAQRMTKLGIEETVAKWKRRLERTRWIPVSERLPEAGEYVVDVAKYYLVQNEYGDMLVARYTHSGYWEQIYQLKPMADEIGAWMPLPQPYNGESEDKE